MIGQSRLHRRGDTKCLVNPAAVVVHVMKCNRMFVICQLF